MAKFSTYVAKSPGLAWLNFQHMWLSPGLAWLNFQHMWLSPGLAWLNFQLKWLSLWIDEAKFA